MHTEMLGQALAESTTAATHHSHRLSAGDYCQQLLPITIVKWCLAMTLCLICCCCDRSDVTDLMFLDRAFMKFFAEVTQTVATVTPQARALLQHMEVPSSSLCHGVAHAQSVYWGGQQQCVVHSSGM